MTDLKRLMEAMKNSDIVEGAKAMGMVGECYCETITARRCKHCKQWICDDCASDHGRWESEEDPKNERRF